MKIVKRFFDIVEKDKKVQPPKEWTLGEVEKAYKERVEEEKRKQQSIQTGDRTNETGTLPQQPIQTQLNVEIEKIEYDDIRSPEYVKLTIVLIENTSMVEKQKEDLKKIVKSVGNTGFVSLINYGSTIRIMEKVEASVFDCSEIINETDVGEDACMYDALVALEEIVNSNYGIVEFKGFKKYRINKIEVIGIGRAIDNFSAYSMEKGLEEFKKVASRPNVVTKYFCLSEKEFINAATIGFRSIGAIRRTFS